MPKSFGKVGLVNSSSAYFFSAYIDILARNRLDRDTLYTPALARPLLKIFRVLIVFVSLG